MTGPDRADVIAHVAAGIAALPSSATRLVAIDGVDGAGKTHFAGELSAALTADGVPVIRASVDGFHQPAQMRYRQGRSSPEGFFHDSHDYPQLDRLLLDPLSRGGSGRFVRRAYDVSAEQPVPLVTEVAPVGAVLVFDGIFTHRDELCRRWDYSIFLHVPFTVSIPRGAQRGYGDPDPAAPSNSRYVDGQRLYLTTCDPAARATVVIDNTVVDRPAVITTRQ